MANKNNPYEDIYGIKQGEANEQDEIISDIPEIQAEDELPKGVSFDELEDDNDEEYYVDEIDDSPISNLEKEELSEFDEGFNQMKDYMPDEIRENKLTQKGKEAKNKKQGPVKTVPFTQPESQEIHNESIEHLSDIPQIELNDTEFNYEVRDNEFVSFAEFDIDEDSFEEISTFTNSSEISSENEEIVETSIEEIEIEVDSDTIVPEFEISTEKTQKNDSLFFSSEPYQSNETFVTIDEPENIEISYSSEEAETSSSNSVVMENDNPNDFIEKRDDDGFVAYTDSYDDLNKEYHSSTLDVPKEVETVSKNISSIPVSEEQKQEYSTPAFTEQLSGYGFTNIEINETGGEITVSATLNGEVFAGYINKENSQVESNSNNFKVIAEHTYNMFSPAPVYDADEVAQFGAYTEIKDEKRNFWSSEEFVSKITDGNSSFSDISIQKNQNDTTTYSGKYNGQNFTIKLDDISHKPLDSNISGEAMSFFSSSLSDYNSLVTEREHKAKTTEMYIEKNKRVDDDYSSVGYSKRISYNELHKADDKVDVNPVTNGNGMFEGEISNPFVGDSSFGGIIVGNTAHRYNPNNSQNNINAIITTKAKASQYGDIQAVEHSQNPFKSPLNAKDLYVQAVATDERHFDTTVQLNSFNSSYDTYNALKSHYNSQESSNAYNKYNGNRYQNAFEENLYQNNNYPSLNNSFNGIHKQAELNNNSTNTVDTSGFFKKIDEQYKLMSARGKFDRDKVKQLGQMVMTPLESKIKEVSNGNDIAEGVHVYGDILAIPKFLLIDKGRQDVFNDCLRSFATPYFNNSENAQYVNKIFRSVTQDSSLNVFKEEYFNKKTGSYELRDVHLSNLKSVDKTIKRYQNDILKDINVDVTRMSSKGISALIEEKKKLLKKEGLSKADIDALNKDIKTLSGYLYLRNFKLNHSEMVSDASWEMLQKAGLKIPKNYKELRIDTIDGFNKFIKEINTQLQAYGIKDIRKLTKRDLESILGKKRKVFKDKKGKFDDIPPEIKKLLERFVSKDGQALLNSFNSLNNKTNSLSSFLSLIRREIGDSDVLEGSMIYLKMVKTVRKTVHYSVSIAQRLAHFTHLDRALAKYGKKAVKKLEKVAPKTVPKVTNSSKVALENARNIKSKYGARGIKERARKKVINKLTKSKSKVANALAKTLHKAAKVAKALRAVSRVVTKYFLVGAATAAVCILFIALIGQFFSLTTTVLSYPSIAWAKITGEDASNKPIVDVYDDLVSQEKEWQKTIQESKNKTIESVFKQYGLENVNAFSDNVGYYDFSTGKKYTIKTFGGGTFLSENSSVAHKNGIEYHYYDSYYWKMTDDGKVYLNKNNKPVINKEAKETGFRSNVKEIMAVGDIFVQLDYTANQKAKDIFHSYVGYKGNSIESSNGDNTSVDLFTATHYFAPDLGELYSCDGCRNTTIKCNNKNLDGALYNAVFNCTDAKFYNGSTTVYWNKCYNEKGCIEHKKTNGYYSDIKILSKFFDEKVICEGYHKKNGEWVSCKELGGHNVYEYYMNVDDLKIPKLSDKEFSNSNSSVKDTCDNYEFEKIEGEFYTVKIKSTILGEKVIPAVSGKFTYSIPYYAKNIITEYCDNDSSNIKSYVYKYDNIGYFKIKCSNVLSAKSLAPIICNEVNGSYKVVDYETNDEYIYIYSLGESTRDGCESQYSHRLKTKAWNTTIENDTSSPISVSVRYECSVCKTPAKTITTEEVVEMPIKLPKYKAVCKGHCNGHNINYCVGHKDLIIRATIFSSVEKVNENDYLICGKDECNNVLHQLYFEPENMGIVNSKYPNTTAVHTSKCHIHGPNCLPKNSIYYADVMSGPSSLEYIPEEYLTNKRTRWGIKSVFMPEIDGEDIPLLSTKYLSKYAWSHGAESNSNKDLVNFKLMNSWSNVGVYISDTANTSSRELLNDERKDLVRKAYNQILHKDNLQDLFTKQKDEELYGKEAIENAEDGVLINNKNSTRKAKIITERINNRMYFIQYALSTVGKVPYYESGIATNTGFEGNNFGSVYKINNKPAADIFGRTLTGLNDTSWIIWAYKSAFDTELEEEFIIKDMSTAPSANTEHLSFGSYIPSLNWTYFSDDKKTNDIDEAMEEYNKLLPGDILVNKTTGRKAIFLMWAENNTLSSKIDASLTNNQMQRMYVIEETYFCENSLGKEDESQVPMVNNVQVRICNREEWSAYSSDILNFGTVKSTYSFGASGSSFPTDVFSIYGMTSPFGYRILDDSNGTISFHSGVDLAGPEGTPLFAISEGKVTLASWCGGYGNCVMIDHTINGISYRTVYGHCSKILVNYGDTVTAGQIIGLMGNTGHSFGSHLHFEVRNAWGTRINPGKIVPVLAVVPERTADSLFNSNGGYISGSSVSGNFNKILNEVKANPSLYGQYFGQSISASANTAESTSNGISLSFAPLTDKNGKTIKECTIYRSVYNVAYETWSNFEKLSSVKASSNSINYLDKDVRVGYKYCYYIQGKDGSRKVKGSEVAASHTIAPKVTIQSQSSNINVSWDKIVGATGYIVYRAEFSDDSWSKWTKLATTSKTSYVDKTVSSGEKYRYTVKAYNKDSGNGFVSYSTYTNSNVLIYLTQPTVTIKAVTTGIKVTWTQSAGATDYVIYRSEYMNGKWSNWKSVKSSSSNKSSWTDTDVKKASTYKYTVRAKNGKYLSSYTSSSSLKY